MGFYFRKSFGGKYFRINLSKSGVSYSLGIKGARLNFSRRGTYVNFGSNGIYYRKKISGAVRTHNESTPLPVAIEKHTITSGDVEEITDIDSQEFINELTEKGKKISYYRWFGVFPLILTALLFISIFLSRPEAKTIDVTETKYLVKPVGNSNINVRSDPTKSGMIMGRMIPGETYVLQDSTNKDWLKINYGGADGYVSRKFTMTVEFTTTHRVPDPTPLKTLSEKKPGLFWTWLVILTVFFVVLLKYLRRIDRMRLLVEIYYEIDEKVNEVYQNFIHHFGEILNCARVWQYLHSERTFDYKYSSGAAHTVTRRALTNISPDKAPSKIFRTNVKIPYLGLINTELYFFPERLIIKRGNQYGAIMYKNISCTTNVSRFIESEGVPRDAVVVDYTWRYLNKNGTPDKRFSNNSQLPICEYSQYSFYSATGLNEKIATSRVGGFSNFFSYIKTIGQLQQRMATVHEESDNVRNSLNK